MMIEHILQSDLINLINRFGDLGVFLAMLLESSIIPVPSEVIIVGAGTIGVPMRGILIFGSLGATIGAMLGYALGRYAAMPVILKFGKFVFLKPHHIYKAEAFAKKYGTWSVLIGRLVPVVPFKVFSIAAGITEIPFIPFVICTFVGVVPRIYLLALFGSAIVKYTKPVMLVLFLALLVFLAFKLNKVISESKTTKKNNIN